MTQRETIKELRAEVCRLRSALAALIGANLDDQLGGYDRGYVDGLAHKPPAGIDPQVLAMGQRISARLTGAEPPPRHLRPVPTA